jgi:DNA-binding transcriptional MerR regulator
MDRHHGQLADRTDGTLPPADAVLSATEVCALMGVSPATLRRWSAAGDVPSFTTPGGHRRYLRSSILGLVRADERGRAAVGESAEGVARTYRRRAPMVSSRTQWLRDLDDVEREPLRRQGQRLTAALVDTLDATTPGARRRATAAAVEVGQDFGRVAARRDACPSDAVAAFLRFRLPFLEHIGGLARRRGLDGTATAELIATATAALDAVLVGLVGAYYDESAKTAQGKAGAR